MAGPSGPAFLLSGAVFILLMFCFCRRIFFLPTAYFLFIFGKREIYLRKSLPKLKFLIMYPLS